MGNLITTDDLNCKHKITLVSDLNGYAYVGCVYCGMSKLAIEIMEEKCKTMNKD